MAVAVLAGLTSGLAGMLVLVLAWLLIMWGDLVQEEQEELAREELRQENTPQHGIWHKRNISEKSCEDIAPKLDGDCAS